MSAQIPQTRDKEIVEELNSMADNDEHDPGRLAKLEKEIDNL